MKRMAIFLGFISLLTACRQVKHDPRPLLLTRYDRELATYMQTTDTTSEHDFLDRHHLFHALYLSEIIALSPDDPSAKTKLAQRLSQPDMRMLDQSVDSCYAETHDIETGLYSLLGLAIRSFMIDNFIESFNLSKYFTVVCDHPEPICDFIVHTLVRSASVFEARGAYSGQNKHIILTALNRVQAVRLRNFIKENEPDAFILISNTSEIIGKGFHSV